MLHFVISIKNVGVNFSPDKDVLCELATSIKKIISNQSIEVYFEYSRAKKFVVKPITRGIYPTEAVLIEIFPQGGMISKEMVTLEVKDLARAICTLAVLLIDTSDPDINTDIPIHTSITACQGISFKFNEHQIVDSF